MRGRALRERCRSTPICVEPPWWPTGGTPLHVAAVAGQLSTFERLLQLGAPVEAPDCDGETAAHLAAWSDHCAIIEALLRTSKSALLVKDNAGRLPFDVTPPWGRTALLLTQAGYAITTHAVVSDTDTFPGSVVSSSTSFSPISPLPQAGAASDLGTRSVFDDSDLVRQIQSAPTEAVRGILDEFARRIQRATGVAKGTFTCAESIDADLIATPMVSSAPAASVTTAPIASPVPPDHATESAGGATSVFFVDEFAPAAAACGTAAAHVTHVPLRCDIAAATAGVPLPPLTLEYLELMGELENRMQHARAMYISSWLGRRCCA